MAQEKPSETDSSWRKSTTEKPSASERVDESSSNKNHPGSQMKDSSVANTTKSSNISEKPVVNPGRSFASLLRADDKQQNTISETTASGVALSGDARIASDDYSRGLTSQSSPSGEQHKKMLWDPKSGQMVDPSTVKQNAKSNNGDLARKAKDVEKKKEKLDDKKVIVKDDKWSRAEILKSEEANTSVDVESITVLMDKPVVVDGSGDEVVNLKQSLRDARAKERATREPRTNGLLFKYNHSGKIERVLTAQVKGGTDGRKLGKGGKGDNHLKSLNDQQRSDAVHKSTWRTTTIQETLRSSANFGGNVFNESIMRNTKVLGNDNENFAYEEKDEFNMDFGSNNELDIQKMAAEADARRSFKQYQSFVPGYGLASLNESSRDKNSWRKSSQKNSNTEPVNDRYMGFTTDRNSGGGDDARLSWVVQPQQNPNAELDQSLSRPILDMNNDQDVNGYSSLGNLGSSFGGILKSSAQPNAEWG